MKKYSNMKDSQDDWDDQYESDNESPEENHKKKNQEIQRMLSDLERYAKKQIQYLLLEGFIEPTDDPKVYNYTPEGIVLAQQQYKKLKDEGLI
jgi:hypothetical protein